MNVEAGKYFNIQNSLFDIYFALGAIDILTKNLPYVNQTIMIFTKLVPNIFYKDINTGLKIFVNCLEFSINHNEIDTENPFCVLEKDGLRINLFQNSELAEKDNPEFRLVTENIKEVFAKVYSKFPELLHPNLNQITLRPWGALEFALMDGQIGIVIQQW